MKTISASGMAALAAGVSPFAVLVSMGFSPTPLNLCSANLNLVAGGITYSGVAGLGRISAVQNTASEIKQIQFELSGAAVASMELLLGTPVQGTPATIKLAILDPVTYAVTDVIPMWAGVLDTMTLDDGASASTITVTAEHVGIDLNRPSPLYYADSDQQTLHPGDLFFQYTSQQFDQQIIWPNANFYRR